MTDTLTVSRIHLVIMELRWLLVRVCLPGLLLFTLMAWQVASGNGFAFDAMLLSALRDGTNPSVLRGPAWLLKAARDVTALGGGPVLTLITVLAIGYLVARGRGWPALILAGASASGAWLNSALKQFFVRERPDIVPHLMEVSSASFPSAHAMNSAVVYLTLAMLLMLTERRGSVRMYLLGVALLLTLVVGATRVYLGVHWPSDVLAGWSIGIAWAGAWTAAAIAFQRRAEAARHVSRASRKAPLGTRMR